MTIKTREKRSYIEAKKLAAEKMINPRVTYVTVAMANNIGTIPKATRSNININNSQTTSNTLQPHGNYMPAHAQLNNRIQLADAPITKTQPGASVPSVARITSMNTPPVAKTAVHIDNAATTIKKTHAVEISPSSKTPTKTPPITKAPLTINAQSTTKAPTQVSNTIATVISQRTELRDRQTSHDKKRDGTNLDDADNTGDASKKGMYSVPLPSSGPTHSPHFPSPTPGPQNLSASGQLSASRDSKRENDKKENNNDEMDYEDY